MTTASLNGRKRPDPIDRPADDITVDSVTKFWFQKMAILEIADDPTVDKPFTVRSNCYSEVQLSKRQMALIAFAFLDIMKDELVQNVDGTTLDLVEMQQSGLGTAMQQLRDYARYGTVIPW